MNFTSRITFSIHIYKLQYWVVNVPNPVTATERDVCFSCAALEDSSLIRVVDEVDWTSGEELYIAPSGFDYLEGQILKIQTVQQGAFILNNALSAFHYGSRTLETVGSLEVSSRSTYIAISCISSMQYCSVTCDPSKIT